MTKAPFPSRFQNTFHLPGWNNSGGVCCVLSPQTSGKFHINDEISGMVDDLIISLKLLQLLRNVFGHVSNRELHQMLPESFTITLPIRHPQSGTCQPSTPRSLNFAHKWTVAMDETNESALRFFSTQLRPAGILGNHYFFRTFGHFFQNRLQVREMCWGRDSCSRLVKVWMNVSFLQPWDQQTPDQKGSCELWPWL